MGEEETGRDAAVVTEGRCLCGAVGWRFTGPIPDGTICNCTACRRYGGLWAYDHVGGAIAIDDPDGRLRSYVRSSRSPLSFDFCATCGNLVSWTGLRPEEDGRTRIAVNLRLAPPEAVADVPLLRFDGLHSFEDLPTVGKTIRDVWF